MKVDIRSRILTGIESLPTLPNVYTSLVEVLESPVVSTKLVAEVISSDQASAFRVLKVANSPFFGFRGRINTINQAIMYLGLNEVKNIVLALAVIDTFSRQKLFEKISPNDFWKHSIAVGITSRIIAKMSGQADFENYFLAGILHDIGKLVFMETAPTQFSDSLELVRREGVKILEAEKKILGLDHTEAGLILTKKWKLPFFFQRVISEHHRGVSNDAYENIVASVHLSNIVVKFLNLGDSGNKIIERPNPEVWDIIRLPHGFFSVTREKIISDFTQTAGLMFTHAEK